MAGHWTRSRSHPGPSRPRREPVGAGGVLHDRALFSSAAVTLSTVVPLLPTVARAPALSGVRPGMEASRIARMTFSDGLRPRVPAPRRGRRRRLRRRRSQPGGLAVGPESRLIADERVRWAPRGARGDRRACAPSPGRIGWESRRGGGEPRSARRCGPWWTIITAFRAPLQGAQRPEQPAITLASFSPVGARAAGRRAARGWNATMLATAGVVDPRSGTSIACSSGGWGCRAPGTALARRRTRMVPLAEKTMTRPAFTNRSKAAGRQRCNSRGRS